MLKALNLYDVNWKTRLFVLLKLVCLKSLFYDYIRQFMLAIQNIFVIEFYKTIFLSHQFDFYLKKHFFKFILLLLVYEYS